jgi:thymidylate synthase
MLELAIYASNFTNAWVALCKTIAHEGDVRVIGGGSERKKIRDSVALTVLEGTACEQILDRKMHKSSPFKNVDQYLEEYTREWLLEQSKKQGNEKFTYTYLDRLTSEVFFSVDQLHILKDNLQKQVNDDLTSNRTQAITWHPATDVFSNSPPCLQRIVVRYLGMKEIDVHFTWRSRDCFNAWAANIIALTDLVNREIARPNDCKIVRVIDYNDSLHVYSGDCKVAQELQFEVAPPYFLSGVVVHKL